jgi:hypothetical protein
MKQSKPLTQCRKLKKAAGGGQLKLAGGGGQKKAGRANNKNKATGAG